MADETQTDTTTTETVEPTTSTTTDPVTADGQADTTATDGKTQEELEAENAANQTAPSDAVIADTHTEDGTAVVQPVETAQASTPEQQAAEQHAEVVALDQAVAEQERIVEVHTQDVDGVAIPNGEHDQAKELYASLLAADLSEESKATLRELGGLLSLNSQASAQADSTGNYAAGATNA